MRATATAVLVVAVLTFWPRSARACSCPLVGPPCQAVWQADAVFVGTVQVVQAAGSAGETRVTFTVEKGFLNATVGSIDVLSNVHGAACGLPFARGATYLVYASRVAGGPLTTGRCSRTRLVAAATEDLRYLEQLPRAGEGARIYGEIRHWQRLAFEDQAVDQGPLPGMTVSVTGSHYYRETVTDENGKYELRGVPVGPGLLAVAVADGFFTPGATRRIELRDPRSCYLADFRLHLSSSASGRVVDAIGRPLRGVAVDAVDAELAGHRPAAFQRPATSGDDGEFVFEDLPPGRYVFGIHLTARYGKEPTEAAVYLPGTFNRGDAVVIDLAAGDRIEVGTIQVPAP